MNKRTSQSGSIASFIVIGVILVLAAGGLLYWARHKDASVARDNTPVVTTPGVNDGDKQKTNDTDKTDSTNSSQTPPQVEAQPPASEEVPTVTTLSQTGPADTAMELFALGALATVGVAFVRSRRSRVSL